MPKIVKKHNHVRTQKRSTSKYAHRVDTLGLKSSDMDLRHVDLQVTYMFYILRYGFPSCGLIGYVCYISSDMDLCHVDL